MRSGAKVCKSCRSRQELSNEDSLANIGFDTAEKAPLKVWMWFSLFFNSLSYQISHYGEGADACGTPGVGASGVGVGAVVGQAAPVTAGANSN